MAIEWDVFDETLYEFARSQLMHFGEEHREEIFYAFALCCNSYYGEVLLSLSSEAGLEEYWQRNYSSHPTKDLERLRWSIGDWKYMETHLAKKDEAWESWNTWVKHFTSVIDQDYDESLLPEFMHHACLVALRLEATGALKSIRQEPYFTVYVADHDEAEFDSWKRLIQARIELSPPWLNGPWPISGRHPDMATAIFAISVEYHRKNQTQEAACLLREALARLPEIKGEPRYLVEGTKVWLPIPEKEAWARAYAESTEGITWADADELYFDAVEKAIALAPHLPEAYYLRAKRRTGGAFAVPGEVLDSAIRDLDRAIALDSSDPRFFGLRAELRSRPFDPFLAIALDSTDPRFFGLRADLRARPYHPTWDQALVDYSRAHELDPLNKEWLMRRAEVYVCLENPSAAIGDYSRVFEIWKSTLSWEVSNAIVGRAKCFHQLERYRESIDDWTRLIEYTAYDKERMRYLRQRAECFRRLGEEQPAAADEDKARQLEERSE